MGKEDQNHIGEIKPIWLEDEMSTSYLSYSMSVNAGRALPELIDGLKHSQRRILYTMYKDGMTHDKPYKKSARAAGSVTGRFHPHGTEAVYGAMVRMAQTFSMRVPLLDGQGNFGSMDGDNPAAMRYTEVRLAKISGQFFEDLDFETVPFRPNYDGLEEEPVVLPVRFPNILVNGSEGIGVGMSTRIPPHNLCEVLDGCCAFIDNPDISYIEMMEHIKGPDFPTGGVLIDPRGLEEFARTGHASLRVRGVARVEGNQIIVEEIPYQVNKAVLVETIADKANAGLINGIADIRDESNREGVRISMDLSRGADAQVVLRNLFRLTQLEISFPAQLMLIHEGAPCIMSPLHVVREFILFREKVVEKRLQFILRKSNARLHILCGLLAAVSVIKQVVELITNSSSIQEAHNRLTSFAFRPAVMDALIHLFTQDKDGLYYLSKTQADAILELKLQQLTRLGRDSIEKEMLKLDELVQDCYNKLSSADLIRGVIRRELEEIKQKFPTPRRTQISAVNETNQSSDLDLIPRDKVVIILSRDGYIKRVLLSAYRTQNRIGRGIKGMVTKQGDMIRSVMITDLHARALVFSSEGRVYGLNVYNIPEGQSNSKGTPIQNLIPLGATEKTQSLLLLSREQYTDKDSKDSIIVCTQKGIVRRTLVSNYSYMPRAGKKAINLDEEDKISDVLVCKDEDLMFLATSMGMCVMFPAGALRMFGGLNTRGVIGIRLKSTDDSLISSFSITEGDLHSTTTFVLSVTSDGYARLSACSEYPVRINRAGVGVINVKAKKGHCVVFASIAKTDDELIIATNSGQVLRVRVADISVYKRSARGVMLLRLLKKEMVTSVDLVRDPTDTDTDTDTPNNSGTDNVLVGMPADEQDDEQADDETQI